MASAVMSARGRVAYLFGLTVQIRQRSRVPLSGARCTTVMQRSGNETVIATEYSVT